MKKGIGKALVLILAAGMLLLPACGKTDKGGNNEQSVQNVDEKGSNIPGNPSGGFMGGNPDLYGEVKAINGNKLTISVLEMPQRRQMTDEERQKMKGRKPDASANPDDAPNPDNGKGPGNPPRPDASGRPGGGGFMGGEKKYTGETVELDVASDTPITSFGMGNRGKDANGDSGNKSGNGNGGNKVPGNIEEKQLSLSDIKAGSVIQVWYDGDKGDKKEIKNIRVMQAFGGSKGRQNTADSQ